MAPSEEGEKQAHFISDKNNNSNEISAMETDKIQKGFYGHSRHQARFNIRLDENNIQNR